MKVIATLVLAASMCGIASAAPLSGDVQGNMDVVETGRNGSSTSAVIIHPDGSICPPGGEAPVPEPASLALLGLGLGAVALRRKK